MQHEILLDGFDEFMESVSWPAVVGVAAAFLIVIWLLKKATGR